MDGRIRPLSDLELSLLMENETLRKAGDELLPLLTSGLVTLGGGPREHGRRGRAGIADRPRCLVPGAVRWLDRSTCHTGAGPRQQWKERLVAGPLVLDHAAIAAVCQRFGVRRLVLFGSAVTGRFDESTSDVDFLVEFSPDVGNRFEAYFGLKESLEDLLGHPVDLVSRAALANPYFAASAVANGREVYAA